MLCIDGGGIRGLVAVEILKQLQANLGDTNRPIQDAFDLICGTSTGGLIALSLIYGGRTLKECQRMYEDLAEMIFSGSSLRKGFKLVFNGARYDVEPLERAIKDAVGESAMLTEVQMPKVNF